MSAIERLRSQKIRAALSIAAQRPNLVMILGLKKEKEIYWWILVGIYKISLDLLKVFKYLRKYLIGILKEI